MNDYQENLLGKIAEKRKEMIELGMTKGFSDPHTIQCSQELDQLLNHYQSATKLQYVS